MLLKPVGYRAGPALSAARRHPRRPDRRAQHRLQGELGLAGSVLGGSGMGGALPESARLDGLRREVHARQHPGLGWR